MYPLTLGTAIPLYFIPRQTRRQRATLRQNCIELHRARRPNGLTSVRFPCRSRRCIQLPANDDRGLLGNDRLADRL